MMSAPSFIPTWKWHLKVLGVLLLLCAAAFWITGFAAKRFLPLSYQTRTATPQITPWLHHPEEP